MTTTLEDIRVGDIMLCPYGVERKVDMRLHGPVWRLGTYDCYPGEIRNPEFRVGDRVRIRGGNPKEVFPWNGKRARPDHYYALVERAPVVEKAHRTIAEYLLDPKTKTNTPRCTLCGHATPRHYASCEHNPEPKGTLISTLGWPQPAPIVVLCQNEEDVP